MFYYKISVMWQFGYVAREKQINLFSVIRKTKTEYKRVLREMKDN